MEIDSFLLAFLECSCVYVCMNMIIYCGSAGCVFVKKNLLRI